MRNINNALKTPLGKIIIIIIILFYPYGANLIQGFNKFSFQVANYYIIDQCLNISNYYSKITNKNNDISYYFRNILINQYINIKKSHEMNFYNSVGIFYSVTNDFKFLYKLNEDNDKLTLKEKEQYFKYKTQFLSELYDLLMEYKFRYHSVNDFMHARSWRNSCGYRIPSRISFYPELASIYIELKAKDFPQDNKTLNDLKNIYETYDIVFNQEQKAFTRSYISLDTDSLNKKQFNYWYPYFILNYTRNIIILNHILHPEIDICKESDICKNYKQIAIKMNKIDPKIIAIIERT